LEAWSPEEFCLKLPNERIKATTKRRLVVARRMEVLFIGVSGIKKEIWHLSKSENQAILRPWN
jgi:hypothetical protein